MTGYWATIAILCSLGALVFFSVVVLNAETVVAVYPSEVNRSVRVTRDNRGIVRLRFADNSSVHSYFDTRNPERVVAAYQRQMLAQLVYQERDGQRMLIVGHGGGTLAMALRRKYPTAIIDSVDVDPVVRMVSLLHFGYADDDRVRSHVADGRDFIERTTKSFDVILLDAYGDKGIPAHLASSEFFEDVRRVCRHGGSVISNVLMGEENPVHASILNAQQAAFDDVSVVNVPGARHNQIFVAKPGGVPRYDDG